MSRLSLPVLAPGEPVTLALVGTVHNEIAELADVMPRTFDYHGQQLPLSAWMTLDELLKRLRPRNEDDVRPDPPAEVRDPLSGWLDAQFNARRDVSGNQRAAKKWAVHRDSLQPPAADTYRRELPQWLTAYAIAHEQAQLATSPAPPTTNRRGATWR